MFTLSKEALIFLTVAGTHRPNIYVLKIKNLVIYYILRKGKLKKEPLPISQGSLLHYY
jgi:hypothetical protein